MAGNRRKKKYGQNIRRGAAVLAVSALCCGLLRQSVDAVYRMWQENGGKTVVYAADSGFVQGDLPENKIRENEPREETAPTSGTAETGIGKIKREEAPPVSYPTGTEETGIGKTTQTQGGQVYGLSGTEETDISKTTEESAGEREDNADNVEKKEKIMYLTFDDGPTAENTVAVLDTLKEKNIKATFFLVGENVEKHPEVARRIAEEGHTIGIHCYSHDYKEIYAGVESYLADFEKAYRAVYEATGVETRLFRFPGGSINAYNKGVYQEIIAAMTERGYIYFDWNASLEDAVTKSTPETLLANARETTLDRNKVVMLCHDTVYNTTLCLGELIDQFPEYRMEPLTPEVAPIQF